MKSTEQQSPFDMEISRVEKQLEKIMNSFSLMKQKLQNNDKDAALEEAFDFVYKTEKLMLLSRELPACTGHPQAQKMIDQAVYESMPIQIGFTNDGWFGVVIPALLPKKEKGPVDFIRTPMYMAMDDFFKSRNRLRYTDCFLVYRHVYKRDRPERHYRDHDKIEINTVTDIIAFYVLYDDSPLHCSHLYYTAAGDENRTEIFVVPKKEIHDWIDQYIFGQAKELILHENIPKKR